MSRLIVALDCEAEKAVEIAEKISDYVYAFKVNYPLVLKSGLSVIKTLSKMSMVIADFKIADVPHMSSQIAECAFEAGAKAVIAHAFVGFDSLEAVVNKSKKYGGEVYAVCELSSEGGKEFMLPVSEKLAKVAVKAGCSGIVAPATRVERIKSLRKVVGDLKIISPGVGAQGGSALEAIKAGADYVIVGRRVILGDVVKNVEEILKEIGDIDED